VSTVPWNRHLNDFVGLEWLRTQSGVVDNPLIFVVDALERARGLGMVPTFGAFDVGCSRILAMLFDSGRVDGPVLHKVFLSEGWPSVHCRARRRWTSTSRSFPTASAARGSWCRTRAAIRGWVRRPGALPS